MGDFVTLTEIDNANKADLYQFIIDNDIVDYVKEGRSIRILDRNGDKTGITVQKGCNLYMDWIEDVYGDSISFLTDICCYSFIDAVRALNGDDDTTVIRATSFEKKQEEPKAKVLEFPEKDTGKPRRLYAYLNQTRGIPGKWIERFLKEGLMYQAAKTGEVIFINKEKTCYEIRSTFTKGLQIKRGVGSLPDDYWYFSVGKDVKEVYVCESAIDAISLMILQHKPGVYVSLHSVVNAEKILKRLRREYPEHKIVLAIDTDFAAEEYARRCEKFYDERIIPDGKDWNEDLKNINRK